MVGSMEPIRTVLPNGCVLIAQQLPSAPLVSLHFFFKGGLLLEPKEKSGAISLMAQVWHRGTETKTARDIDEQLESRGAELRFSVSHEGVSGQLSCLPQDFPDCAALLAEILRSPTFPEEEVVKQRTRMMNSLRDALTRPEVVSYRRFLALAYPSDHPLHRAPEGDPETIGSLSREELVLFYKKVCQPQRAIFAIVGDLPPQQLLNTFASLIADWDGTGEAEVEFPSASLPETTTRDCVSLPDKSQTWVAMGHKGIRRTDEQFYAANVLATILGSGWGRLFTQIRDNQGLAYAVGASLQAGLAEGPFVVRMGVNPKDVDRAIESALVELHKIRNEPSTQEEVEDAKNYLLGRLVLSMETTNGVAAMLVSCELYGLGLDYPQRAKEFYAPITQEQVQEAAQNLLHPERMAIAIAGP